MVQRTRKMRTVTSLSWDLFRIHGLISMLDHLLNEAGKHDTQKEYHGRSTPRAREMVTNACGRKVVIEAVQNS